MGRRRMSYLGLAALMAALVSVGFARPADASLPAARVTIHPSSSWVVTGDAINVSGSVAPASPGSWVSLERFAGGRWVVSATQRLSKTSGYRFTAHPGSSAPVVEKVRVYAAATSRHRATLSLTASFEVLPVLKVITNALAPGVVGRAYNAQMASTGGHGPLTWFATGLPFGITLSGAGQLTGTPSYVGEYGVQLTVSDTSGHVAQSVMWMVVNPPRSSTPSDWRLLTAGYEHTCGIKANGTAWCWGVNNYGQMGSSTGDLYSESTPMQVGTASDWTVLSAGYEHTCGVKTDGTAWCWGSNLQDQLGTATNSGNNVPNTTALQVGSASDWASITAGYMHTCGLKTDGTAWCWGNNGSDQLGSANAGTNGILSTSTPTQVAGTWTSLSAGGAHTCGIKNDGTGWCWGSNRFGQLGGSTGSATEAATPIQIPGTWTTLTAGLQHTCGIQSDGSAWCWGLNVDGQLGSATNIGTTTPNPTPSPVAGTWSSLSPGWFQTCGTKTDGTGWCWGQNQNGQLAQPPKPYAANLVPTPTQVTGSWSAFSGGSSFTCGIKTDQSAWCWGSNQWGQLGTGGNQNGGPPNSTPIELIG